MSLTLNSHSLNLVNLTESNKILDMNSYNGYSYGYFDEALNFVKETKSEYRGICRDFYVSIHESTSIEVVNESFDSFCSNIKRIIDNFLAFIKKMIDRFIASLNKFISSDKYLKTHKDELYNFSADHIFEMKKYVYTNLDDPNFPNANAFDDFDKEYNKLVEALSGLNGDNLEAKFTAISDIYSDFTKDLNKSYDSFRAKVLTISGESPKGTISESEYAKALFNIFRDGGDKQTVTVCPVMVSESLVRFENYASNIKIVKSNKTNIESQYTNIKKKVEAMVKVSDGIIKLKSGDTTTEAGTGNDKIAFKLDAYMKTKSDQIVQYSTIHTLAISAKLDAITECFKADKALLYKALQKVNKKTKVHESVFIESDVDYNDGTEDVITDELNSLIDGDRIIPDVIRDKTNETLKEGFENFKYTAYLLNEMAEQNNQARFLNETVLKDTGVTISYVTEAGKLRNLINKIIQSISRVYGKFLEWFNKLFKDDKAYLTKYKDIILQKKPVDAEISQWYDYKLQDFVNLTYPQFNFGTLKSSLVDEKTWRKKIDTKGYDTNPEISVGENIKNYIRGEETTIRSSQLKMTDIFNYVYGFDTGTKKQLEKDIASMNTASKAADQIINTAPTAEATAEATLDNTIRNYFNEVEIAATPKSNNNSNSSVPNQDNSVAKQNVNVAQPANADDAKSINNSNKENLTNSAQKDYDETTRMVQLYFTTASSFLSGKMQIATEIYNAYFKIIRWHVQQFNNKEGKHTDRAMQKSTDYKNDDKAAEAEQQAAQVEIGKEVKDEVNKK